MKSKIKINNHNSDMRPFLEEKGFVLMGAFFYSGGIEYSYYPKGNTMFCLCLRFKYSEDQASTPLIFDAILLSRIQKSNFETGAINKMQTFSIVTT